MRRVARLPAFPAKDPVAGSIISNLISSGVSSATEQSLFEGSCRVWPCRLPFDSLPAKRMTMRPFVVTAKVVIVGLVFLSINSYAQHDQREWPSIELRFPQGGTLKDIFDAGLRPYRFPTLERSLLEAKHAQVTVIQQGGERLSGVPAERITIGVLQGGFLSSMEMIGHKATLRESRAMMLPYLSKGGQSTEELDRFLAAVEANFLDYDDTERGVDNFVLRWSESQGPRYSVTFRKAFDPNRPLIFFMSIDWSQVRTPRENRTFYKEPVPPPPGYENISMQAPPKFGPDSQADILASEGKLIASDKPFAPEPSAAAEAVKTIQDPKAPSLPGVLPEQTGTFSNSGPTRPMTIGLLALLAFLLFTLVRRR